MKTRAPAFQVDPLRLASGTDVVTEAVEWASARLASGPVLVYATADAATVKCVQNELGAARAGALVESRAGGNHQPPGGCGGEAIDRGGRGDRGRGGERTAGGRIEDRPRDRPRRSVDRHAGRAAAGVGSEVGKFRNGRFFRQSLEQTAVTETTMRDAIAEFGRSIFERGLTAGSSGNISVRLEDGWLLTPTNACLGRLDAARISKLDWDGRLISGDPPSKEAPLHLAMYQERAAAGAVVHLHSTYSAAVSCMRGLPAGNCIPAAHCILRDEDR